MSDVDVFLTWEEGNMRARPVSRSICWDLGALWPQEDPFVQLGVVESSFSEMISCHLHGIHHIHPKNGGFLRWLILELIVYLQFNEEICFVIIW